MVLLRDDSDFAVAIGRAAQLLDDLDPTFVEKDYWVTQVLRALHAEYPGGFLFKGGTSLSKGYGIIERFSEDIDILVVPLAGASNREREDHLRAITGAVAAHIDLPWREARQPGRGRFASRGDFILYKPLVEPRVAVGIGPGAVLLETGYVGGQEPAEMVTITPLLCQPLGIDTHEFEDTSPFDLRALEPVRTLIEKLVALHHIATLYVSGDQRDEERFGRHYYDVYKLLDHQPTLKKLGDRASFNQIVGEVERISRSHFGGTTSRPDDGFAASPAFALDNQSDIRKWVEGKYLEMLDLLPGRVGPPTFGQILKRVQQHAPLL